MQVFSDRAYTTGESGGVPLAKFSFKASKSKGES